MRSQIGRQVLSTPPLPNLKAKAATWCHLENLFPQSVLPTREDGEVLGDPTWGEDKSSLTHDNPSKCHTPSKYTDPLDASPGGAWFPPSGPLQPACRQDIGGEPGKGSSEVMGMREHTRIFLP